jgi:MEMO1 family protein
MGTNSFLVFTGIAPHPPIMVPEVGGHAIVDVQTSIDAMAEFTRRVIDSGARTVVIISPHAPLEADSFVIYEGPVLIGDFTRFLAPEARFAVEVDERLNWRIGCAAQEAGYQVTKLQESKLDHGTAVPLYFLLKNGWQGKVVALGYSYLSNEDHLRFGEKIKEAIDSEGSRVAVIASGDLSHRLKPDAPAGYNPEAHVFDDKITDAIRANNLQEIELIDRDLMRLAGECGYRSMLVAIGTTRELMPKCELISYEAPFGVGYMVAQLAADNDVLSELPRLARRAVETRIMTGLHLPGPERPYGLLAEPSPCFVSIKTRDGELRGCIGTIESTKDTLAEELIANAIGAATNDPRFYPIRGDELNNLCYSVDVLMPNEPAEMKDLDPEIYGVIVEDRTGNRRGLLLPDIRGIKNAEEQVKIASRKAGIGPKEPIRISRFKVLRFRE